MPTALTLFIPTPATVPTEPFAPPANSTPKHPDKYFYADQYSNDANWQAHYHGTANEIWQQTEGRVTHFVSMMGTSGTFVGTTRRLKELNPAIRCISLQPDSPFHGIEGAKHMASAIIPKIYDAQLADEDIGISTEDAYSMAKRLAREEGLLVGISAAAAVVGCLQVARKLGKGERAVFVTILCDSGDKYLSERFWEEGLKDFYHGGHGDHGGASWSYSVISVSSVVI